MAIVSTTGTSVVGEQIILNGAVSNPSYILLTVAGQIRGSFPRHGYAFLLVANLPNTFRGVAQRQAITGTGCLFYFGYPVSFFSPFVLLIANWKVSGLSWRLEYSSF
jgi:hypothetical protein